MIRPNAATARGFAGAPTMVRLPSRRSKLDIRIDVVIGGDGVENEIEALDMLLHLVGIARDDDLIRAETKRVFFFPRRSREDYNVGSERMGKFHAHVAQSAETDHANFLAFADAPAAHGRVGGDSGAEQRRGSGEVEIGRERAGRNARRRRCCRSSRRR